MNTSKIVIAVILALSGLIFAGPLDKGWDPKSVANTFAINGKFYHDLELISVKDGIAEFDSKEGHVSAAWTSLPLSYQKHHETEKLKFEAREKARKIDTETPRMNLEVIQVLSNGVLADQLAAEYVDSPASGMARIGGGGGVGGGGGFTYHLSGKTLFVQGITGLAEHNRVEIRAKRDGVYTYTDTRGASRTVEKWTLTETLSK